MQEIEKIETSGLINVDSAEKYMMNLEQADCPVAHHFGPDIYIREVTLPAGIIAIGHAQKYDHLNIMITGKVAVIDDGMVRVLEAPLIFVGKAGRKVGYVIETCVWQNVYSTPETDIDKLEAHFLDKSPHWIDQNEFLEKIIKESHQSDRDDYLKLLDELNIDDDLVRQQSENLSDYKSLPSEFKSIIQVRDSHIEGKGLFSSWLIPAMTKIAPARINGFRTEAGRYVNHSCNPNCAYVKTENGDIDLFSIKDISGCQGGSKGEEITVNYRQALYVNFMGEQECQE